MANLYQQIKNLRQAEGNLEQVIKQLDYDLFVDGYTDCEQVKHQLISAIFLIRLSRNILTKEVVEDAIGELNDHT